MTCHADTPMKRLLCVFLVCLSALLPCVAGVPSAPDTCRKKVALVLSGGGAKGMAHIGVLRVIERAGIPIDIITGTSMGALIGGLYSVGYDAETLDSLVGVQNWKILLSDRVNVLNPDLTEREKQNTYILSRPLTIAPKARNASGGLISGTNLAQLFTRLTVGWHDSIDFAELPIPFACVATDIVDNTEYDFHSGYLSTAMRASMAIPGVFTPVRIGSKVLVDGGLRNNYPADVARRMGADVIIGVSVQSPPRTADELQSGPNILMQIVDINCKNKYKENWEMTDIPIRVNVKGFSSASFNREAIDTLIARGESAALEHWDELVALRRSLGLPDGYVAPHLHRSVPPGSSIKFRLDSVSFGNIAASDRDYIAYKYKLSAGHTVTARRIEQAITALTSDFLYANAGYNIRKHEDGYILRVYADSRRTSRINLGVRFDTEVMVALQANMSHRLNMKTPVTLEFTGRLGKRMAARLDAEFSPLHYGKIGLSYSLRHDDINIYEEGRRGYNFTYNRHTVNLRALSFSIRNFTCDLGLDMDFYDFHNVLVGDASSAGSLSNVSMYSYAFNLNYDSEDRWFFTTRGTKVHAGFSYSTDNFVGWNGRMGISVVDVLWRMSFPFNSRFVLQPMIYGRALAGSGVPLIMRNAIGGQFMGQYIGQQLPFAGIGHVEFTDNALLALQLRAQQRMGGNNYVIARLSLGQRGDKVKNLFRRGPMMGCEAAYYYNSMFGPIGASLGYSGHTGKVYFYINLGYFF